MGTLLRPPISPISEEVDKVSDCVVRGMYDILIYCNNNKFCYFITQNYSS